MDITKVLPEECLSIVVSFTSPKDACRLSVVSPSFKNVADSDVVWERFLPSGYKDIINQCLPTLNSLPKKQIYMHLCDHPVLLANDNMSVSLEKASGKKCCMVGAKGLKVVWGDTPQYWSWESLPISKFSEVAILNFVWWLEVMGSLETKHLSPNTNYVVYFVFNFSNDFEAGSFMDKHVELAMYEGSIYECHKSVILQPLGEGVQERGDGWIEVEMGEFFNEHGQGLVDFRIGETSGSVKKGLIVEGVEFRPKQKHLN